MSDLARDVDDDVTAALAEAEASRREGIDDVALQWLALVPEWTDTLAVEAGFPVEGGDIKSFVRRVHDAQLCKVTRNLNAATRASFRFRMYDAPRRDLIARWIEQDVDIRQRAREVAQAVARAAQRGVEVALGVKRWADLALEELRDDHRTGNALTTQIGNLVRDGQTEETPTWLYAGKALEAPLGAEMTSAVRRARTRLTLHYRSERDERLLTHYLERDEQVRAIDRLLDVSPADGEQPWAMHFIGMGGAGKTMLLRHLTGPYARRRGGFSTARLDFDHVDPRYPTERPGQLLAELADDLSIYVEDRTREHYLASLRTAIERADIVAKATPPAGDALVALRTREFASAISAFASFAESLSSPVLLILDTCEELAKLHPAGENVPSIDATFEIFDRICAQAPSVRVVFAGRRHLTSEAANWKMREDGWRPSVLSYEPRPYLKVHEVPGFDRSEVHRYLADVRGLSFDDELFEAILRASHEIGSVLETTPEADKEPRYNPFDIARYGDWMDADPDLTAAQLATSDADPVDPYVRVRIMRRLEDAPDVLDAIPYAAMLGRFDASLLEEALPIPPERRRRTVLTLAEHEWIKLEAGSAFADMVLAVEPQLLPRLRRYFEHPDRAGLLRRARERLQPILHEAVFARTSALPSIDAVDGALRVLPVEDAVAAFDALAVRVADDQAWSWANELCSRLLAIDREQIPEQVQASVRALYASALQHRGAKFNGASLWTTTEQQASLHPDAEMRDVLAARASLGRVAALLDAGRSVDDDGDVSPAVLRDALTHPRASSPALRPALLRVAEAVLDIAEARGDGSMSDHVELIVRHLDEDTAGNMLLRAFSCALLGRAHALAGRIGHARPLLGRAVQTVGEPEAPIPQTYADWVVPAAPLHRLLLEQLRHELAATLEPARLLNRCQRIALVPPRTIDEERLLSLVVRARLAQRPLDGELLERVCELEATCAPPHATAPAHHAVPPLFVSVAEALLADGQAERALDLLAAREDAAVTARDEATVRASAQAILRMRRRLRLDERLGQARELAVAEHRNMRAEALAAIALIVGDDPRPTSGPEPAHITWRASTLAYASQIFDWRLLMDEQAPLRTLEERVMHALDRVELALTGERFKLGEPLEPLEPLRAAAERLIDELARSRRGRPDPRDPLRVEITRIALRAESLGVPSRLRVDARRRSRATGEVALEEGELMALRLPEVAAPLLVKAAGLLEEAGDLTGAFVAVLRAAIADVHAGDHDLAMSDRELVEERHRAAQDFLARRSNETFGHSDGPWRGWTQRLEAYRAWCRGDDPEPWRSAALELWMTRLSSGPERRRSRLTGRRLRERIPRVARMLLWLTLAAASALVLLVVLLRADTFTMTALLAVAVVVFVMQLDVIQPGASLLAFVTRPAALVVNVEPASEREHPSGSVLVTVRPCAQVPARLGRIVLRLWQQAGLDEEIVVALDDEPFQRLPRPLVAVLGVRMRGHRDVRLSLTPDVAPQPWEARLVGTRVLRSERWSPKDAPIMWRRAQAPPRWQESDRWGDEGIAVVAAHEMQPFVRRALGESGVEAQSVSEQWHDASHWGRAVLMLGTPVATGSGWRLRLNDEPFSDEASFTTHDLGDETFVSPERGGEIAPFVIVQALPGAETPVVDRRVADGLRGFANEAAASGVHAVLAIPSLPSFLAHNLLATCAQELRRWDRPPSTQAMTRLLTDLRMVVYKYRDPLQEGDEMRRIRAQVAYDICLYVAEREA